MVITTPEPHRPLPVFSNQYHPMSTTNVSPEDIPRSTLTESRKSFSASPTSKLFSIVDDKQLTESQLFVSAVSELEECLELGRPPLNMDRVLAASVIIQQCAQNRFPHLEHEIDVWKQSILHYHIWKDAKLSSLSRQLVEDEIRRLLVDWLSLLKLTEAAIQDAIWTVFAGMLADQQILINCYHIAVPLAGIIFACAKLFDYERSFIQIIKAALQSCGFEESIFLNIPCFGNIGNSNILHWYNQMFLPVMRVRIFESKRGEIKFPSSARNDFKMSLSKFVSLTASPYRHHLRMERSQSAILTFKPWWDIS